MSQRDIIVNEFLPNSMYYAQKKNSACLPSSRVDQYKIIKSDEKYFKKQLSYQRNNSTVLL